MLRRGLPDPEFVGSGCSARAAPPTSKKPRRVPQRLRKHLDMLVEHGLIEAYTSPIFELERFSLKRDIRRRVSITLPISLLENLTDSSFVGKKNPFSAGRLLD